MPCPDFQTLMVPSLGALASSGDVTSAAMRERVAEIMRLAKEDLEAMLPSGKHPRLNNRGNWVNPFELIAVGADIGRDIDRERTKELKSLVFNVPTRSGGVTTYELNPDGELVAVFAVGPTGQKKTFTPQEYYVFLENALEESTAEELPKYDPKSDPRYAGTFDDEFRIYHSKQGHSVDSKNQAFFLPADDARQLERVGAYYVSLDRRLKYFYVVVHPVQRVVLGEPGFLLPSDEIPSYDRAPDKADYLDRMASSSIAREMTKKTDPFAK